MMDASGKFIYVSPAVISKFDFSYDEFLSMNTMDIVHPDDIEKAKLFFEEVKQKPSDPVQAPLIRNLKRDGSYAWVEGTITNLLHMKGVRAIVANFRDVTEKKAHLDALEKSNVELRKSNSELDKFVYSVSHDLRAPLISMEGVVNITEAATAEELTSEHMKMLRTSINKLDGFIGDILDYSRNSRLVIKKEIIDFKKLVEDVTSNLKYMGGTSKVEFNIEINDNKNFCSDKGRISIVLNNLISNAIRYGNAENPVVRIKIDSNEHAARMQIEDNGIGIPEEFHQKIFEMFYRVSENSVGSGLGLYIVKDTIDKLNGEIQLDSQVNVGTKFSVKIPNLFYQ